MTVALAIAWLGAAYRLKVSLAGPHALWRWSFTAALVCLAAGLTVRQFPGPIDDALGFNTSTLLTHLLVLASGGGVAIYLLTLTRHEPERRWINGIIVTTAALMLINVAVWAASPIHTRNYPEIGDVPGTEAYNLALNVPLNILLLATAFQCARFVVKPHAPDPSRTAGLALIAASSLLGAVVLTFNIVNSLQQWLLDERSEAARDVGNALLPIVLSGIGAGTVIFLAGPEVLSRIENRRLLHQIKPLSDRLGADYPTVSLTPSRRQSTGYRLERAMIEIHDGLSLLRVTPGSDPYQAIADALNYRGRRLETGVRASTLLPAATTPDEDRQIIRDVARAYREETYDHAR
ncbi:DUF6545 domain-containing protein [Solicola sp. PLA-1-18]|uniref:DUF6545 domain-containing protein n=1 Tax=Solicola sp. PLA-1-18 TaxID=3380532 RepID=UPI003B7DC0AD